MIIKENESVVAKLKQDLKVASNRDASALEENKVWINEDHAYLAKFLHMIVYVDTFVAL